MTRESIQLNPDKVRLHIARRGLPRKMLLDGMTTKTVDRIKSGKNTTLATAHKLAAKLDVTVEDLVGPFKAEDIDGFLPNLWLYDHVDAPSGIKETRFLPCAGAIGGDTCLIDLSPTSMTTPIDRLLAEISRRNRKIVLRQEDQAFVIEIHYFYYSSDHSQTVVYDRATACRFFPMARNGDTFKKTGLGDWAHRYVWNSLQEKAMSNAEIVSIEGHDYPDHPDAYFYLVRFKRGMAIRREALGARIFARQYGFTESLLAYLKDLPAQRVQARLTGSGIAMTVKPVRPAIFDPDWSTHELEIKVNLAWRRPDGQLAFAPWRHTSREQFVKGIASRDWRDLDLHHMPLRPCSDDDEDAEIPLFEVDPSLPAETIAAIDSLERPSDLFS